MQHLQLFRVHSERHKQLCGFQAHKWSIILLHAEDSCIGLLVNHLDSHAQVEDNSQLEDQSMKYNWMALMNSVACVRSPRPVVRVGVKQDSTHRNMS